MCGFGFGLGFGLGVGLGRGVSLWARAGVAAPDTALLLPAGAVAGVAVHAVTRQAAKPAAIINRTRKAYGGHLTGWLSPAAVSRRQ
jgi:hypothetical protein